MNKLKNDVADTQLSLGVVAAFQNNIADASPPGKRVLQ